LKGWAKGLVAGNGRLGTPGIPINKINALDGGLRDSAEISSHRRGNRRPRKGNLFNRRREQTSREGNTEKKAVRGRVEKKGAKGVGTKKNVGVGLSPERR